MEHENQMVMDTLVLKERSGLQSLARWMATNPVLVAGILSVLIPTMIYVATKSWTTEQGAHGPIVLAAGLWLLWREWLVAKPHAQPAPLKKVMLFFVPLIVLYFIARVSQIIELEGILMYAVLLVVLYSFVGATAMKIMWFPLLYLLFIFPPPETFIAVTTNPLKILLSEWATNSLHILGYPIGHSGVTIQIGQYSLLVADACSGLNSLISLTAIGLFYVYLRHHANIRYALLLILVIVPVAVFANLVRIQVLILLTYYGGEAAAQGFLHDFAGLTTFFVALVSIFAIDELMSRLFPKLRDSGSRTPSPIRAG